MKSTSSWAVYHSGAWEIGALRASQLIIGGKQVVGPRASVIPGATGGTTIDAEARSSIEAILAALRQHGLLETE